MSIFEKLFRSGSKQAEQDDHTGFRYLDFRTSNEARQEEGLWNLAQKSLQDLPHLQCRASDEALAQRLAELASRWEANKLVGDRVVSNEDAAYQEMRRIGEELWGREEDKRLLKLVYYRAIVIGGSLAGARLEIVWDGIGTWRK
jgi:hypothetical protein